MNLSTDVKIVRVKNGVVAGTSAQACTTVDTQGYDGCLFLAALGALTANQVTSLSVAEGTDSGGSGAADLLGSKAGPLADGDGNKCLVVDVFRPAKRYLTATVNRATANAVIDGVWAILYRGRNKPAAVDASVAFTKTLASPAEGTA